MSFFDFLLVLAAGAAVLAVWSSERFPTLRPADLRQAALHFGFSLVLVWTLANTVELLVLSGSPSALTAALLLVLPALVYSFLAVASILRLLHEAGTR